MCKRLCSTNSELIAVSLVSFLFEVEIGGFGDETGLAKA